MVVRDRATVVTSVILLLIAAVAWVDVVRSSLGDPDMMMTMFMPMTVSDGLAFVEERKKFDGARECLQQRLRNFLRVLAARALRGISLTWRGSSVVSGFARVGEPPLEGDETLLRKPAAPDRLQPTWANLSADRG